MPENKQMTDISTEKININLNTEEKNNNLLNEDKKVDLPNINPSEVPIINYDDFKPIIKFDNLSDEEICNAAMNRLTQDTYFGINGLPLIACWLYVYNKARIDTDFSKKVCIKSKCFTRAFDYLSKEVKSMCGNNGVGLDHREIFAILEEYYDLDDKAIAEKEAERKAEDEAKRKKRIAESKAKNKTSKKSDKTKSKAEKESKIDPKKQQENLFDLLGGSL